MSQKQKSYEIAFRLGAKVNSSLRNAFQKASNQMEKIQDKAEQTSRKLNQINSSMSKVSSSIGRMSGAMRAGIAAAGVAVGALAAQTTRVGVSYNAMMEQSLIAWETILGSQEEAKKTLQQLQIMGAKTPYEFEGLDKAAKLLNMAGFEGDKLFSTLTNVGDAVAAIGGGQEELEGVSMAIFQMATKGKVSAEEMNQLAERGIPAWKLISEQMGISQKELMKMSENGKLFSDEVIPLLVKGMGDRFGGAMKKQSNTFNGLMSTLKDNAKIFAAQLSEGVFEKIKNVLPIAIQYVERFSSAFEKGGWQGIAKEILPESVVDQAVRGFNIIKNVASGFINFLKNLGKGNGGIGSSFISMFQTLSSIAMPILKDFGSFLKSIGQQLVVFWGQYGPQITKAIQNVFQVLAVIFKTIAPVILFVLRSVLNNVKGLIQGAVNIILGLVKIFTGIFTLNFKTIASGLKQLFGGAVQFLWNLWNLLMVGKLVSSIKNIGVSIFNWLKNIGQNIWTNVQYYYYVFQDAFYKIAFSILKWIGQGILKAISFVRNGINTFIQSFQMARTFGVNIFMSIVSAIRNVFSQVTTFVVNLLKNMISAGLSFIKGFFTSVWNGMTWLYNVTVSIFNAIKNAIINPIKTAKSVVSTIISSIKGLFSGIFSGLTNAGRTAINGLIMAANALIGGLNKINIKVPDWVPKIGGKAVGFSIPKIPMLAEGGITTGPTLAMIGEGSEQEAVLPLSKLQSLLNIPATNFQHNQPNINITYSPQNIIHGNADQSTIEKTNRKDYNEFKRFLERYFAERDRLSFRG